MRTEAPEHLASEPTAHGGLDAFVSYSRRDQSFVLGLKEALERRGRNVWIDADDIPPGAAWRRELGTGIEAADAFVFVISPNSVASPECAEELDRAVALGKRLVPVHYRPAADVPGPLASIQYIHAEQGGGYQRMVEQVDAAITTDHDWVRAHTEWLARALRWEEGGRDRSRLLRGSELDTAERWLTRAAEGKQPPPTSLQAEYIAAGRQAERSRLRVTIGATLVALAVSMALGVLALISRNEAIDQRDQARSREVAARAIAQLDVDPERSLLLALAANEIAPSGPADDALRRALTLSHVRAVMPGNGGGVSDLAISPDGSRLVVAARDGTARVFDPRDGRPIRALRGHRTSISTVDLSPDGKRVVTASDDGTARVWDLGGGRTLATLRHDGGPVHSAAYGRDGQRVVTAGGDGTTRVWGAASGRQLALARDHDDEVLLASFHPDGRTVLSAGGDGTARLWDTRSGRGKVLARHTDPVFRASFSEDGRRALTVDARGSARIWDTARGRMINELGGVAFNAALSPDGRKVVTTTIDATVTLWDADTGAATPLVGHGTLVRAAAFSPDATLIVTGGQDETARVWDAEQGTALAVFKGHYEGVNRVTFIPGGHSVVTGSEDGTARRWDLGGQIVLRGHGAAGEQVAARVNSAEMSRDGRTVLTAATDATARLWNARTGKEIKRPGDCGLLESASFSCLAAAVGLSHVSFIQSAAFSPDGRRVASAGGGDTAFVHEARSGARVASLVGHEGGLLDIDYSPDGEQLVTAGRDATARIWRADTGRELAVLSGHRNGSAVNAATFMPDGRRVVTAGGDGTVRLWNARGGPPRRTFRLTPGGDGGVLDVAASPDGRLAVPIGETARVIDARTGRPLTVIREHDGLVFSASISADGRMLVTGGQDLAARVFELPDGRPLGVLRGHSESLNSVAFTPDGRAVVTAGNDGTARIFRCDVCGSTAELLRRARRRATRELTADERRRFLTFGD
jgi:WD40 repeat protein